MFKIAILFCNIFLASCGTKISDNATTYVPRPDFKDDPQFAQYKTTFENIYKNETGNNSFTIGDIPIVMTSEVLLDNPSVIGVCYTYSDNKRAIVVKDEFWNRSDVSARQVLINHELGHCRLNRGHNDETHNNVKLSVMHSQIVLGAEYFIFRDWYNAELITGKVDSFKEFLDDII